MPAHLARIGVAVFAMLFAIALIAERPAAGRALVRDAATFDLPELREAAPIRLAGVVVAGVETAPAPTESVAPATPLVVASWYGPGFYGNRTACGQTYTPELLGVAHLALPCGTLIVLTYGDRSITVPVIDRGPYVPGRVIDLSNATKLALGCTDLCTLRMQIAR
jgi:rare lipoprotein A (peptidoglycan hydrolase)